MDRAGAYCGGQVVSYRRDKAVVVVDLGGGYGGPVYEHLSSIPVDVKGFKGAEMAMRRSVDRSLKFTNKRSAAYWLFREALDPGQPGGSPVALPNDPVLIADLTAPTFLATPNGIQVEPKGIPEGANWKGSKGVAQRLGRSPDRGDAVVMAWYEGPTEKTASLEWQERTANTEQGNRYGIGTKRPQVLMGRQHARR